MEKEINIIAPEGYEIDKENSTFECIKFKPIQRFKVGDWVVSRFGNVNQVIAVDEDGDGFTLDDGTYFSGSWKDGYHPWTIQDAKDGDVLFHSDSASNGIFIFKEIIDKGFAKEIICYCDYDSEDHFCLGEHHTCCWADAKILHPATKEQRGLLFQKMKEAGYGWDADKKELNLLITNGGDFFELENCEQKPTWTWSEKDEETLSRIRVIVRNYNSSRAEDILWLKSLKDRVQPQPKYEWKQEDGDFELIKETPTSYTFKFYRYD